MNYVIFILPSPSLYSLFPLSLVRGTVSKIVIPVKTGIQIVTIRHDFWIPACAGMTKRLKTELMIQSFGKERGIKACSPLFLSYGRRGVRLYRK